MWKSWGFYWAPPFLFHFLLIWEAFRDTNGEYHATDPLLYEDPLLFGLDSNIFGGGGGGGRARLGRTQEDLGRYRQRIDASVEQQREYSEIIAAMQNKAKF